MLKIDNINSTQSILETYTKTANSDTYSIQDTYSLQKESGKDTFTRSTSEKDIRYYFPNTNNNNKTNNYLPQTKTENQSILPAKFEDNKKLNTSTTDNSKSLTNLIGPDIQNINNDEKNNKNSISYQVLQNIDKDIKKQIELLSQYYIVKVSDKIKKIEQSQLM